MPFFKTAKFKIFRLGNVQLKDPAEDPEKPVEQTVSESKLEPEPEPTKPAMETNGWNQELQDLQPKWQRALQELHVGFANIMRFDQDGQLRFFYCLKRLGEKLEAGKTTRELLCLRDDFKLFRVTQIVHWDLVGVTNVQTSFERIDDPESFGLKPAAIKTLVKEVCNGNTPI